VIRPLEAPAISSVEFPARTPNDATTCAAESPDRRRTVLVLERDYRSATSSQLAPDQLTIRPTVSHPPLLASALLALMNPPFRPNSIISV